MTDTLAVTTPAGTRPHPGDKAWLALREQILDRDGWRCQNCGAHLHAVDSPADLDRTAACVDHIVPIVRGGWHTEENLQALCLEHNATKGNQVIDYRSDVVLRALLEEQIAVRGIDVDAVVRYTRRDANRERRTMKVNIAVTPTEKAWIRDVLGSDRALVDVLTEAAMDLPEHVTEPA